MVNAEATMWDDSEARKAIYTPLRPWQTRLVEVLPAPDLNDALQCRLYVADITLTQGLGIVDLWRSEQYECLSYSWGRPDLTATILCNGLALCIPPEMATALRYLRPKHPHPPRWLWCDAICINQQNVAEMSAQVQIMLDIFSRAFRVTAWLGESTRSLDILCAILKQPAPKPHELTPLDMDALTEMLRRGWFRRTWIRQEVFASKDLNLQCGLHTFQFGTLCTLLKSFQAQGLVPSHVRLLIRDFEEGERLRSPFVKFDNEIGWSLINWETYKKHHHPNDRTSHDNISRNAVFLHVFLSVLGNGVEFGASEDRDRVYGLLGAIQKHPGMQEFYHFSENCDPGDLTVDYSRGLQDVFQEVTIHLIRAHSSLRVLEYIRLPASSGDMCSWAIDWRQDTRTDREIMVSSGDSTSDVPCMWSDRDFVLPSHGDKELVVQGILLGKYHSSRALIEGEHLSQHFYWLEQTSDGAWLARICPGPCCPGPRVTSIDQEDISDTNGMTGLVLPRNSQDGDLIVFLHGSDIPFVLRPSNTDDKFVLVGPVFIIDSKHRGGDMATWGSYTGRMHFNGVGEWVARYLHRARDFVLTPKPHLLGTPAENQFYHALRECLGLSGQDLELATKLDPSVSGWDLLDEDEWRIPDAKIQVFILV